MNPPVQTTFGNPDPNAAPVNITQLVTLLNTLVFSAIQGSYIPYVLSNTTPGSGDQDKAWIQLDTVGRPIALKTFYNGMWRRVYNGMLGEIRMYNGNPNNDFDSTGLGKIGGQYDGWALCNSQNGTPNMTDLFVVGAHMDNSAGHTGYGANGWQTFVDGVSDLQNGGVNKHTIAAADLPPLDGVNGLSQLMLNGFEAKETSPTHTAVSALVDVHYSDLLPHSVAIANYGSNPNGSPAVPQTAVPTLPPFLAVAFIIFVGY